VLDIRLVPVSTMARTTPKKPHAPRNYEIAKGVMRYSRSAMFRKRGKWLIKNKTTPKKKQVEATKKREPSVYPTLDSIKHVTHKKRTPKTPKLRASIKPGQVLILLAGKFKGKRVVFLKQLASGLLLVTGPFRVNGVPLRRVNQAYVIATSTNVAAPQVDAKFNDAYFTRPVEEKKKKTEVEFFADKKEEKKAVDPTRSADQKTVDGPILEVLNKNKILKSYLKARFSLKNGQYPHAMKF